MIAMAVDLLSWPMVQEAEALAAAARDRWQEAQRRVRCAPHGERLNRLKALQGAAQEALSAELAVVRARRGSEQ